MSLPVKPRVSRILAEYDSKRELFAEFTEKVETLVRDALRGYGLKLVDISSRVKDRKSLERKITSRRTPSYADLYDINDISGVRVVTLFCDQLDLIAEAIRKEFEIDRENSVDKRALLDPDRFGYLSLHYVAKLSSARVSSVQYERFSGCKAEIQIRSVLQHAWAELYHDLGYKAKVTIPNDLQRRFSRLAGLLEIADAEFVNIRDQVTSYVSALSERVESNPASVRVDKHSLFYFATTNPIVREVEDLLAKQHKFQVVEDMEWIGDYAEDLHYVGIQTLGDLQDTVGASKEVLVAFSDRLLKTYPVWQLPRGFSLFYLCYLTLVSRKGPERLRDYVEKFRIGSPPGRDRWVKDLIGTYEAVVNGEAKDAGS